MKLENIMPSEKEPNIKGHTLLPGMVVHMYNPNTGEAVIGGS
jgi:hypothetical protein